MWPSSSRSVGYAGRIGPREHQSGARAKLRRICLLRRRADRRAARLRRTPARSPHSRRVILSARRARARSTSARETS
jgi:hypothetical protein